MALDSYTSLQTAILDWLVRPDLTAVAPDWIRLLEARVAFELRLANQRTTATGTLTAGTNTLSLPSDFLEAIDFYLTGTDPLGSLDYMTPVALLARADATWSGQPSAYTIIGTQIRMAAIPDSAYPYALDYYKPFPALSVSNATNWLLTNAPGVYLYGSLMEAAPYIGDDARVPMWAAAYQRAVDMLEKSDDMGLHSGAALRVHAL